MTSLRSDHPRWGAHRLVVLPGLDGGSELFGPLCNALDAAESVSVLPFPRDRQMSYGQLADWTAERLPHGPLVLLGHSFSGPVAMELVRRGYSGIAGVIFCVTFLHSPRPWLLAAACRLPLSLLLRVPLPEFAIHWILTGGHKHAAAMVDEAYKAADPRVLADRFRRVNDLPVVVTAQEFDVPALYLQAIRDRLVPAGCVKRFQERFPRLQKAGVDGPHAVLLTDPQNCARIIDGFMRQVAGLSPVT